jgi:glutamate synthase (NADPH/NADH) small chain
MAIRWQDRNESCILPAEVRKKTFREYDMGYTFNQLVDEADRCIYCRDYEKRCKAGCPVGNDIPVFIQYVKEGNLIEAYKTILKTNPFPEITGRVCPQERLCEGSCILTYDRVKGKKNKGVAVGIGAIERFIGDFARLSGLELDEVPKEETGKKIAIIGAGPGGLTAGYYLRKKGHEVHIFDALPYIGGVMAYGIPPERLDRSVLKWEEKRLKKMGIKFHLGVLVGKNITLYDLYEEFDAIILATGSGRGKLMGIPGEDLNGVYTAIDFLTRVNMMKAYDFPNTATPVKLGKRTAVVGGGFTAVDCVLNAIRLGVETHLIYRRTRETSSARDVEWDHVAEEGAILHWLTQPIEIIGDEKGNVKAIKCIKMQLVPDPKGGRPRPKPIEGSEHIIEVDSVILAVGQDANPTAYENVKEIQTNKWNNVDVDEKFRTSWKGVFAIGDLINGGDTVVRAIAHGRKVAEYCDEYLKEGEWPENWQAHPKPWVL